MKHEAVPAGRAAVLAATLSELTEKGYAALTVDNVARPAWCSPCSPQRSTCAGRS